MQMMKIVMLRQEMFEWLPLRTSEIGPARFGGYTFLLEMNGNFIRLIKTGSLLFLAEEQSSVGN